MVVHFLEKRRNDVLGKNGVGALLWATKHHRIPNFGISSSECESNAARMDCTCVGSLFINLVFRNQIMVSS